MPADTGMFLRIESGIGAGRVVTLSAGGTHTIGREGADVALADAKVSRKHAELILLGPGRLFVRDLASTNGTFLNGRRLTDRRELAHDDRIRVGDTVLAFSIVEGSIPVPASD